jgi:hypothetical protein
MASPREGWRRRVTKEFALEVELLAFTDLLWLNVSLAFGDSHDFGAESSLVALCWRRVASVASVSVASVVARPASC